MNLNNNKKQQSNDDNVKVAVRCRPLNTREEKLKCKYVIDIDLTDNQMVLKKPENEKITKSFRFDYVYGEDSKQKEVYEDTAYPLVESVLEGYNGTIFAYGQTGCGKTWTMEGPNNGNDSLNGIIPSSFQHIFDKVNSDSNPNRKYLIRAGYIEIYNEEIRDLLGKDSMKKLNLRENPDKGVYVESLTMMTVKNVNDTKKLMDKGRSSRVVGRTNMNAVSSRSHAIFVLNVETSTIVQIENKNGKKIKETKIKAGKLNLVDLAGSERQSKTGASGVRFKEATKINLSLSALGNVISALVEGKGKHIPYRDSKLTRLLQDSLGGNTKTVMIACISPADNNYDETLSTLRYANRAKNIKNKPKINEDPKDALLKQYQDEIKKLKEMLKNNSNNNGIPSSSIPSPSIPPPSSSVVVTKEVIVEKKVNDSKLSKKYAKLKKQLEQTEKDKKKQENIVTKKLEKNKKENEETQNDMMEQIYLLESQLLEGGQSENKAKERLNDMKSKRNKRKQQKQKKQSKSSSSSSSTNKWKLKYMDAQNEIEDLMEEFENQRSDLLQDIRTTYREMTLYRTIVYKMMDSSIIDQIIYQSQWDNTKEIWILPSFMDNYNNTNNDTMSPSPNKKIIHQNYLSRDNIPYSVKQQINEMNLSFNEDQTNNQSLNRQTIENIDISEMTNINQFENVQIQNKQQIYDDYDDNDVNNNFLQHINEINDDDTFKVNDGINNNDDGLNHELPNKDINIDHDFIAQLTTIQNKDNTFSPSKVNFIENEQDESDGNMMDIANLMVNDKPIFKEEMDLLSPEFVSPDKSSISEYDDVLSKMITNDPEKDETPKKQNLFKQHKKDLLHKKQDIQDGNFFNQETENDIPNSNDYTIDITELHQLLNRKK